MNSVIKVFFNGDMILAFVLHCNQHINQHAINIKKMTQKKITSKSFCEPTSTVYIEVTSAQYAVQKRTNIHHKKQLTDDNIRQRWASQNCVDNNM